LIPHTFLVVTDSEGNSSEYGFVPTETGQLVSPGKIEKTYDHEHHKESEIIPLDKQSYDRLMDFIKKSEVNPPEYNLPFGSQCANWAFLALREAGIDAFASPNMVPDWFLRDLFETLVWNPYTQYLNIALRDLFRTAAGIRPTPVYDPLAIDLQNDGIQTVAIDDSPVTFDHNADGVRTGTGWISSDDAWLALDRNGNGLIDSGRELLGTDYVKADNQFARSGADALSDLDSHRDGVIDAQDAAFRELRLWQDLNQNGISDSGELFSLADKGIAQISLTATTASTYLGNGNTQLSTLQVTRADGSSSVAADLHLAHNPFYRDFQREAPISDIARSLPQMRGAGWVRNLREAMSLGTPAAQALIEKVQAFAAGTTKAEQLATLDELIRAWAASNEYKTLAPADDPLRRFVVPGDAAASARLQAIIPELEIFNGLGVAEAGMQAPVLSQLPMAEGGSRTVGTYTLLAAQVQPLLEAYERLRESLYEGLVLQTRLKPYLDAIEVNFGEEGLRLDTSGIAALATQRAMTDPLHTLSDLLELRSLHKRLIPGLGWNANAALAQTVSALTPTPELTQWLAANQLVWIGADTGTYTLSSAQNGYTVIGNDLDNTLTANGSSANQFIGGKGNDTLIGGYRADSYHFARGDGADTVIEDWSDNYTDTIQFGEGITADDIGARRDGANLVLTVAGQAGDQIAIHRWFESHLGEEADTFLIERLRLADGSTIDIDALAQRALDASNRTSDGADTLVGAWRFSDRLVGGDGNDTLQSVGRNDVLDGGPGDDTLRASTEWDEQCTYIGGPGKDLVSVGGSDSTVIYHCGDGNDTIDGLNWRTELRFGEGISFDELAARRSGDDLVLTFNGSADDSIVVRRWFRWSFDTPRYRSMFLSFEDGSRIDSPQLAALALATTNTGTAGDDILSGTHTDVDHLQGGEGNDQLTGVGYDDVLDGGSGNDVLRAYDRNTLIGGAGSDTLFGAWQNDTYVYRRGDGSDTITEWDSPDFCRDVLNLGEGIAPQQVSARRVEWDLLLTIDDQAGGRITVQNWFRDTQGKYRIEELRFADGTVWLAADVTQRALAASNRGSDGDDVLTGWALQADRLEGANGNDTLSAAGDGDVLEGGAGDDVLRGTSEFLQSTTYVGGPGQDSLQGSRYDDLYLFQRGDGADIIQDFSTYAVNDELRFGAGILPDDLVVCRVQNDLVMQIAGQAGDSITVKDWFGDGSAWSTIERIGFHDGTVWTAQDLGARALLTSNLGGEGDDTLSGTRYHTDRLLGGAGHDDLTAVGDGDVLEGGAGNDVLRVDNSGYSGTLFIGGTGKDTLHGSYGADTYVFNRGDGVDTLIEQVAWTYGEAIDTLRFGEGIRPSDIQASREGSDLVVEIRGSEGDRILVRGWFDASEPSAPSQRIERVVFADGSTLSGQDLALQALASFHKGTDAADTLTGTSAYEEYLAGGAGNDRLQSMGSGDVLDGGPGDDTLIGSYGRDVYLFKRGDGHDTLSTNSISGDELRFGEGITASDLGAQRDGLHLLITLAGPQGGSIKLENWFAGQPYQRQPFSCRFVDGTVLSSDVLTQAALSKANTGTSGNDVLTGVASYAEHLRGGEGDDRLVAAGYNDVLDGGPGTDVLLGSGSTTFVGGPGQDTLVGGPMDDVYRFNRGDGADTLIEDSRGFPSTDRLVLGEGIRENDLWLSRAYDDLRILFLGGYGDSVQIKDWYKSPNQQLEAIQLSDGQALLQSQVNVLVEAMAAFGAPAAGQIRFTPAQETALAPVLAAAWQ